MQQKYGGSFPWRKGNNKGDTVVGPGIRITV
jgi:hypothetical protein